MKIKDMIIIPQPNISTRQAAKNVKLSSCGTNVFTVG